MSCVVEFIKVGRRSWLLRLRMRVQVISRDAEGYRICLKI